MSLTGTLITELGLLTNLQYLWAPNNALAGTIPTELAKLSGLTDLKLCELAFFFAAASDIN